MVLFDGWLSFRRLSGFRENLDCAKRASTERSKGKRMNFPQREAQPDY